MAQFFGNLELAKDVQDSSILSEYGLAHRASPAQVRRLV